MTFLKNYELNEYVLSTNMQHLKYKLSHKVPMRKSYLELNSHHPLVTRLRREADTGHLDDWTNPLFEQAGRADIAPFLRGRASPARFCCWLKPRNLLNYWWIA